MAKQKAAVFVDNSNIFLGLHKHAKHLKKQGKLESGQYLRVKWDTLLSFLEAQNSGIDIFARHFFASLPPASDVTTIKHRPSEEEWEQLVKRSSQTGFYKLIQNPPFNFTLHGIPLRYAEVMCRSKMKHAYYKCLESSDNKLKCKLSLDIKECNDCENKYLHKYEKGVDVALAVHLIIFATAKTANLDRIIIVAGDGDYKEAARYIRQEIGKDLQIVSWKSALSKDLEKLANQKTIYLEDHWKTLCDIRSKPPLEEIPAVDMEPELEEEHVAK